MATVIGARVYEYPEGYVNSPTLQLLLDKRAADTDFVYRSFTHSDGSTSYYAEHDGEVRFMHHNPKNENGYGGSVFALALDTGETIKVRGPWSSRPGVIDPLFGTASVDVSITDDPAVLARGHTFFGGNVTLDLARSALQFIPGWDIVQVVKYGEKSYELRKTVR